MGSGKGFDQLAEVVRLLKTNPTDRKDLLDATALDSAHKTRNQAEHGYSNHDKYAKTVTAYSP
jgi:hypothetical protein